VAYATGFVVEAPQLEAVGLAACSPAFIKSHRSDPVFALKWHVGRDRYEILPGERDEYISAIDFIPWRKNDATDVPEVSEQARSVSYDKYANMVGTGPTRSGRCATPHAGLVRITASDVLNPPTMATFVEDCLQDIIRQRKLWHFPEPVPLVRRRCGCFSLILHSFV
jgi:hypothetical protein